MNKLPGVRVACLGNGLSYWIKSSYAGVNKFQFCIQLKDWVYALFLCIDKMS